MPVRFMIASDNTVRSVPESLKVTVQMTASSVSTHAFVAPYPCELISVQEIHSVAGTDASAVTVDVTKCTNVAPSAGTSELTSTFNLKSAANTLVAKTVGSGVTGTRATRQLAKGDSLALNFSGVLTSVVGVIELEIKRIQSPGSVL